ncbi:MATE family efflux transporter [uncultured Clostridium sp.]|uniref:MATE family efflux transporter n=1 Tax=uncultured Clostridium sp. TaxID=59620 RepID=UPI0025E37876|nr:MATE family efflux transporter [uncultured Clostridium sp.]
MDNSLGKKVTFLSLIKYTFPTIMMMMFFSLYTIIDGMFISRFVNADALSATNIVYPVINILLGLGIMLATGGSAIVAKLMGENKNKEARESFTSLITTTVVTGVIIAVIGIIFIKPIIYALGSTDRLYSYSFDYLFTMLLFSPVIMTKMFFDYFLVTAGHPKLGLLSSILGGITNIILDYIFIIPLGMGIKGAALATCIGYALPCIIGVVVFVNKNNVLHFEKGKFRFDVIIKSCSNGISEMITQISSAVTTFLFNIVMLKYLGENGVAAITIVLYAQFLMVSAYLGFTSGVAPRISYNYGKDDREQLNKIIKYSYRFIAILSIISFILSMIFSSTIVTLFTERGTELYNIALSGFKVFSLAFLICGFNIFTSGMFTAFSNGKISAILSILRTFVFFIIGIAILPSVFGVNGIWLVVPIAELGTIVVGMVYIIKYKKVYHY